nr:MAG TPA: hypothetical protein [Bacteriophage sp.]
MFFHFEPRFWRKKRPHFSGGQWSSQSVYADFV